jgi:hypothetical protein
MDRYNLRKTVDVLIRVSMPAGCSCLCSGRRYRLGRIGDGLPRCRHQANYRFVHVNGSGIERLSARAQISRMGEARLRACPYLSKAVEDIERDVWSGITSFGWRTKAGIETGYPLMELMRQLSSSEAISGNHRAFL